MIVVHAKVPLDPEHREAALDRIEELAEQTRAEPGAIDYRATTEVGDPTVVHFVEYYEDEAAGEAHSETDHYRAFEAALPEIAGGEIVVKTVEVAGEPEVSRVDV